MKLGRTPVTLVFVLADNGLADLLEQLIYRIYIIISRGLFEHIEFIVFPFDVSNGLGHISLICQVTLIADKEKNGVLVGLIQVFKPQIEIVEAIAWGDTVAKDANLNTSEVEMRQVVDRSIPCSVPDV